VLAQPKPQPGDRLYVNSALKSAVQNGAAVELVRPVVEAEAL